MHGLGFAGALPEIGIPQNCGAAGTADVRRGQATGQVIFVVAVSLLTGLNRISRNSSLVLARTAPYAIGGIAAF